MSSDIVSRWPVRITLPIQDADLDVDGRMTDAAVERCFAAARAVYFGDCSTINLEQLQMRGCAVVTGTSVRGNDTVTISVNVVEVFPDRFTMAARLRPADREGVAADARCSLGPASGEVSTAMRDEFIARAHAAAYTH
jgi:hypothetical protein